MIVLIPAYEPDHRLVNLIGSLRSAAPDAQVVTVDDGSGPAYRRVFDAVERLGCTVLRHAVNLGKGRALKSGFRHIAQAYRGQDVVCADADGQHSVVDILRVAGQVRRDRLVLGTRRFTGRVPLRSRVGNSATRVLFAAATGCRVRDTQTGLRAYPASMLDWLQSVPGDRFEYEMNVLLEAARTGRPVEEADIATIYLERNASSHFRPFADSVRIYRPLLRFSASSVLAFGVDTAALLALHAVTGALLPSVVGARALSSTVNFLVNRRYVFAGERRTWHAAAVRYWLLVAALLAANFAVMAGLTAAGLALLPAKLATEATLFTVSYLVQRRTVFTVRRPPRRVEQLPPARTADHRSRAA
ncbi:bifunctional glycosyltransferase family 2/GtrA family protein [Phytohabitans rumicis]